MSLLRIELNNIYAAKYIAERWTEPLYQAVITANPKIKTMPETDIRLIIGVCAELNITHKSLFDGDFGSHEWAQSVAECAVIMAYIANYDYGQIPTNDDYWINTIERARSGALGEIPGTHIETVENEIIKPCYKPLTIPKRVVSKDKIVQRYIPRLTKTYLMRDDNTGKTKIGKSINPRRREKTLLSDSPVITLFAVCERDIEKELHSKYAAKRVRGEWFDLTQSDIEQICKDYQFNEI